MYYNKSITDPENIEAADLQRKLEMLNNIMDQEARAEQARRQMQYFGHCKLKMEKKYLTKVSFQSIYFQTPPSAIYILLYFLYHQKIFFLSHSILNFCIKSFSYYIQ